MKCPPPSRFLRRVICHEVSSPSRFFCFLATEFLFMATILQLRVAKRHLFEKVSLERDEVEVNIHHFHRQSRLSVNGPVLSEKHLVVLKRSASSIIILLVYYIHFEITGNPCNLVGSQLCDLFLNFTIFVF